MRAAIRQIAVEEITDQFFDFRITQRIIGFDRMTANGFGDHVFAQTERRGRVTRGLQLVYHRLHKRNRVRRPNEDRQAVDFERVRPEAVKLIAIFISVSSRLQATLE